jgi:adenine/guanine/hypoxanthine permease
MKPLHDFFDLAGNRTSVRTEVTAGLTTFVTMAYIILVNPAVLSTDFAGNPTGLDPQAVMLATCVAAAVATAIMGLLARYPIAQAPGMGNNHFFVSVVMALGAMGVANAWQVALGLVFFSGVGFFILSLLNVREALINALSPSMRAGIAVGIGLFITFIGLRNGQIIVQSPGTLVSLNPHLFTAGPAVFALGLLVMAALHVRGVRGSLLIGVGAATALAIALGMVGFPDQLVGLPHITEPAFLKLDLIAALTVAGLPFLLMFLFMDMFDTMGTLVGVAERGGFMVDGKLPRAKKALMSDAIGTMVGALCGTSTVTSYIESASGVEEGGRTGLVNLVVAGMFLLALLFAPLVTLISSFPPITAPALVVVGVFMAGAIRNVAWDDLSEALPAFLIMLGIPLAYSIADGLAMGFISYPVVKFLSGRGREVHPVMFLLAALMVAYFVFVRMGIG